MRTDYIVLAAGPYFGGPMTQDHRMVLLKWRKNEFSVHTQYRDGTFSTGRYYGPDGYEAAASDWLTANQRKFNACEPLARLEVAA